MVFFKFSSQFHSDRKKVKKENAKLGIKILELIESIEDNINTPLSGIGNPELLKGNFSKHYSRRVNGEHRLVYTINDSVIYLISCYGHYGDK